MTIIDPFHDFPGQPPANLPLANGFEFEPFVVLDPMAVLAGALDINIEFGAAGLAISHTEGLSIFHWE